MRENERGIRTDFEVEVRLAGLRRARVRHAQFSLKVVMWQFSFFFFFLSRKCHFVAE